MVPENFPKHYVSAPFYVMGGVGRYPDQHAETYKAASILVVTLPIVMVYPFLQFFVTSVSRQASSITRKKTVLSSASGTNPSHGQG